MSKKRGPLGKGLDALLPMGHENTTAANDFFYCDLGSIQVNPLQPRSRFDQNDLEELTESIRTRGIIQPLVVRKKVEGNDCEEFVLVAGERRLRAARLAGLLKVPVVVRNSEGGEQTLLEDALIENIQRQNLNPLEEAKAYQRLIDDFQMTQEKVAKKIGKKRSTVANLLRLLQLPLYIQEDIANGTLTAGHARVLVGITGDENILLNFRNDIINKEMSVRDTEREIENIKKNNNKLNNKRKILSANLFTESYCQTIRSNIENKLGTKIKITQQGSRGKIEIEYNTSEDFEKIINIIISEQVE